MPPKNNSIQARETLYNNLVEDGYSLGSFSEFEGALKDVKTRIALYDNLTQDGYELGDYDSFIGTLGYNAPENTVLTKVTDKVKEVGTAIGANLKETATKIAEVPQQLAESYKAVGVPQTEEQAFEFAHYPTLTKLAEQTEQEFISSDEYKELSKAIANAPTEKRQELIDQLQNAYLSSPSVQNYAQEVERMALEAEADKDPILKVQLLSEEIQKRQQQLEEIKPVSDIAPNTDFAKAVEEYEKTKSPEAYNKLTAALRQKLTPEEVQKQKAWKAEEKRLKDEIYDLNKQLSQPLNTIADEGLKKLDEFGIRNLEQQVYTYRQNAANDREYAKYSQQNGGNDLYYEQSKRLRGLQTAEKLLKNLKGIANASSENGLTSLWQGIKNNDFEDLLSLGLTSISENVNLADIAERIDKGETVSPDERYAVEVYGLYQNLASQKELPATYGIGQSFIQSLPFMVEIATTGGLRSAVGKGVSKSIGKSLAKSLPKLSPNLTKAIAKGTGYAVGTMAAVPVTPMTYKTASERQLGSYHVDVEGNVKKSERAESLTESLGWASLQTFITLTAEDGTFVTAQGMKYTGKGVGRLLGQTKRVRANSKLGSYMKNIQKHTRWNGFLQEIGEEYDEALLTNLLVPATAAEQDVMERYGTSRWDDFFDPKKAVEIVGSIALTQILLSAPAKVNGYYQSGKARADLKKAQSNLPESISRRMVEAMNLPDFEQQQQAIESIDFSEIQDDEVLAVQKYILSKNRYDILKGRAEGMEQAERVEQISKILGSVSNGNETVTIGKDSQGKQHFILSDNGSDGVIAMETETGKTRMIPRSDLVETKEYTVKELKNAYEQQELEQLEQENEVIDQQEVAEEIEETPAAVTEPQTTTTVKPPYSFGDEVTVDGVKYRLGNELENGSWVAQDEQGTDVVLSAEQLQGGNNSVPEEVEKPKRTLKVSEKETLDIIQQENGTAELDHIFTSEKQAQSTANKLNERYPNSTFEVVNNTDSSDPLAEASYKVKSTPKTNTANLQSTNEDSTNNSPINSQPKQKSKPKQIQKSPTPYQQRLFALSEKLSDLTDIILFGIASGSYKFSWKDKKGTRGLASELGLAKSVGEMRTRIGILSNNGYTVEQLAHHIWEETEQQYDIQAIRDEIIALLYHVNSKVKALNLLEERIAKREGAEDYYQDYLNEEEVEEIEGQKKQDVSEEILDDEAKEQIEKLINIAVENGGTLSEIENIHTAADLVEYIKLLEDERIWEQEQTSNERRVESSNDISVQERLTPREAVPTAERGNRPAEESPAIERDSGAGTDADTHRVEEESSPDLTDAQRKLADESILEYDQAVEQAEKEFTAAQNERSQKLKEFGKRQASEAQGSLFGDDAPSSELFDISSDYSQQNMERIFKPIEDKLTKAKNKLESLKEGRSKFVEQAISDAAKQGDITQSDVENTTEEILKIEEENSDNSNNNTNFEQTSETSIETADNGSLNSSENIEDDERNDRALPNDVRQNPSELDAGESARVPVRADEEERAESSLERSSEQGVPAGSAAVEGRTVRDRSRGNSNEQDSSTLRPIGDGRSNGADGDRAGRSRTVDGRTDRRNRGASTNNDLLNQRNYVIDDANSIVPKGEIAKIKANIKAIQLLKTLEQEVREATPEEKQILAQYSGWGGLSEVLNKSRRWDTNWAAKYQAYHDQLIELLTPEEFDAAVSSTINAHYTSGTVVTQMWRIAEQLGFNGGTVLEPAVGTGNFFGLMPKHLSEKSALRAYELDSLTGRIMAKLYPDAYVKVTGYESSTDTGIDLIITNVPFGQIAPYDKHHKDLSNFSLHNYFIAKGIRQLAPNGLGIFISSSSTMDSGASAKLRQWVSSEGNADFIGAIRLPNNAFADNAGTSVTTDILIFRKRDSENASPFAKPFRYTRPFKETTDKEGKPFTLDVNEYFADNPSMMLGEMMLAHEAKVGGLYSANDATLVPHKGQTLQEALSKAVEQLPKNISDIANALTNALEQTEEKDGSLVEKDGKVYEVEDGVLIAPDWADKPLNTLKKKKVTREHVAKHYLQLKRIASSLIEAEREDKENIEELRKELNRSYDAFVKEYGRLNNNIRLRFLLDSDIDYNIVFALEDVKKLISVDAKGNTKKDFEIKKADIFSKRVIFPVQEPTTAESLTDAIEVSIAYRGSLDTAYIADLTGSTVEEVEAEMLNSGLAYLNPETGLLEDRDSYLSGYVRSKYRQAVAAAEGNPDFEPNVRALKEAVPADIPATQIKIRLGSPFIEGKYIESFVQEKLKVHAKIKYSKPLGMWVVDVKGGTYSPENTTTYGTKRISGIALLEKGLNQRQPEIYDTVYEGSKKTRVKNLDATAEAQNALHVLASEFESYIADSEEAMAQIEKDYNELYNDFVEKKFSVPTLTHYPNASKEITLRQHQKVAVSRGLKGSLLLAHQVGTGKTFTMQTIAMEKRRLGIAKKPMLVVQNATLEQFALSFKQLYPSVKLLTPTKKMMDAKNRQRLFSLIAYGDYDAIVIPQSFVDMIPDDEERVKSYIKEQIAELERVLNELEGEENSSLKRELELALTKLEDELDGGEGKKKGGKVKDKAKRQLGVTKHITKQADRRTDNVLTFEQMGIDALLVDEAHAYKKLGFFTKMSRIKGIDTGRSKRAFGMYLKTQFIQERSAGNNVIFATGTPITNTMAEVWTMMKFISPDVLEKYNITSFDEFATTFGSVEPSLEFTSTGSFKIVERFKSYINAPELLTAFRIKTHVILTEDIPEFKEGNNIPKLKDNDFTKVIIPQSEGLIAVMEQLKKELQDWEKLPPKQKKEKSHVPLVVFNKAKQAAIDLRLLNPYLEDSADSKTNHVVSEVKRIYDATQKHKGTQLIFSDMFQSPENMGTPRFNLYQDIKKKLVNFGVPEKEIAIIHDYEGQKRELLFEQLNSGEVRILLGSTERMGVGVNVQERLAALHHIDAPPRPMDFEQRNGRIIRQGNMFALLDIPIEVVTYGVEKTLDATAYQRLAIKQKFINQMMKGENLDREVGDNADEDSPTDMTFDQMMSTLSGSQYAVLHVQKSYDLKKLETAERNHKRRQIEINKAIKQDEEYIEEAKASIQQLAKASNTAKKQFKDEKIETATINGKTHTEKLFTAIDEALQKYLKKVAQGGVLAMYEVEPLAIQLNNYATPLEVKVDSILNNEFAYSLDLGGYKIKGDNIRTGQGLLSSVRSRLINLDVISGELQQKVAATQDRIPVLKKELSKPFDKQDKLNQLLREVAELEELMQQETEATNKKDEREHVEQQLSEVEELDSMESEKVAISDIENQAEVPEPTEEIKEAEPAASSSHNELITPIDTYIHTKNNTALFRARLSKEVEKDMYFTISNIAKKHGKGYWSRYAKGFLFKTKEDAESFRNEVNSSAELGAKPVELGFSLKGIAEVLGFTKGTRPLDVRGGAILKRFADREIYIKSLQNKVKELGGKVNSTSDVYNDMTLSIGRSTYRIQQFEQKQLASLTEAAHKAVEKVGSRWKWTNEAPHSGEAITPYEALELYLRARDIVEAEEQRLKDRGRMGFELAVGVNPEVFIMQYETRLGSELKKELWDKVRAATSFGLQQLNDCGMLTDEECQEYSLRSYYVPQRGWKNRDLDDTIYEYLRHSKGQFYDSGYNPVTVRAKGRTSLSSNPIPYIQSMAHTAILIAERNKYKKKALQLVLDNIDIGRAHKLFNLRRTWYVSIKDENGNPVLDSNGNVLWEEVFLQPDRKLFEEDAITRRQIAQLRAELLDAANANDITLAEQIRDRMEYLSKRINVVQSASTAYRVFKTMSEHQQNEVMVWLNGQQYVMIFDDERVANAINKADYESVSGYLQNWFGRGTRWLAAINTSKNPSFAIFNFLRDYGFANLTHLMDNGLAYSGKFNINVFNPKLHAAIFKEVTSKKNRESKYDDLLSQFFADGAATGYSFLKDLDQLKTNIEKEFARNKNGNPLRWTKGKIKALSNAFGAITEYSELITRFATYVTSLDMGRTRHQAAVDAKNVTVNFNRKGTMSPILNMFYMFFNATIQGGMRAADVAIRHKGKLAAAAASLYLLGFLNTLFTMPDGDDDENKKFSEFDRKQNAIVFGIKIPLPHFFRAFWGAGAHTALAFKGEKEVKEAAFDSFKDLGNEFVLEQFNLLSYFKYNHKSRAIELDGEAVVDLLPSMIKPFGELAINKDFAGRTIYKVPYVNADKIPKAFWAKSDIGNLWQELSYLMLEAGGGDREIRKLYNTETGSYISSWYNVNPEALEHLFTSYTGGVGRFFNDSYKTLENAANGKFEATTVPVLNRFVKQYDEDKAFLKDYYTLTDKIRDIEFARDATKKAIIGKNGQRYDKALDEYKQLLSSERYVVAMKAKVHLKNTMDKLNKILGKLDEENNNDEILKLLAERTRLMKKAKEYLNIY